MREGDERETRTRKGSGGDCGFDGGFREREVGMTLDRLLSKIGFARMGF